ncbi:unnamed protein product [Musa hybrid cultivar]
MHILLLVIFLNAIANYRERWNKGFCSKIMKGTAKGSTFLLNFSPKNWMSSKHSRMISISSVR